MNENLRGLGKQHRSLCRYHLHLFVQFHNFFYPGQRQNLIFQIQLKVNKAYRSHTTSRSTVGCTYVTNSSELLDIFHDFWPERLESELSLACNRTGLSGLWFGLCLRFAISKIEQIEHSSKEMLAKLSKMVMISLRESKTEQWKPSDRTYVLVFTAKNTDIFHRSRVETRAITY